MKQLSPSLTQKERMLILKSINILFVFTFICVKLGFAQHAIINDTIKIHRVIVATLKENNTNYKIYYRTEKKIFSNFNFNDPTGIDTSSTKIWKRKEWKFFLNNIDTAKIIDYSLISNGKLWFKNLPNNNENSVVFAPVLMSKEKSKALGIIKIFSKDSGSVIVWYLEKEKNFWKIKDVQTVAYFD